MLRACALLLKALCHHTRFTPPPPYAVRFHPSSALLSSRLGTALSLAL